MGVLLLPLTLLVVGILTLLALRGVLRGGWSRAARPAGIAVAIAAAYLAGLWYYGTSTTPRVIAVGQPYRFCGFYLDCHLSIAVKDFHTAASVHASDGAVQSGAFIVVTLLLSSDAKRATLHLDPVEITLLDASGRAHRALSGAGETAGQEAFLLTAQRPLAAGESREAVLVYELPATATPRGLRVRLSDPVERGVESILIGDEDALFHPRTTLALARP